MRAMVCSRFGGVDDLVLTELPDPEPGPGMVAIDVEAAGVNFADLLMVAGRYQVRPEAPFVPGFEVSGRVIEVGAGVRGFSPGDRVMAFMWHGGFGEKAVASASTVFPLPSSFDFVEGAAFLAGFGTAGHALADRGRLRRGEWVVVLGASGSVGSAAVQLASASGANVVAVTGSDGGERLARRLGAVAVIRRDRVTDLADAVFGATGDRWVDVVVDPVGGRVTDQMLDVLGPGGRFLVVGFAAGTIAEVPLDEVRARELELVGVYWGLLADRYPETNRELISRLTAMATEGSIRPAVGRVLPLHRAREALESVKNSRVPGRVVLLTGTASSTDRPTSLV